MGKGTHTSWTPVIIFNSTKAVLVDCLGLDNDEVQLDSHIQDDLGAESIDWLDILHRMKSVGIVLTHEQLMPSLAPDDAKVAINMDQAFIDKIAAQFDGINVSHLKPGRSIQDLFTVRFLCEVAAKHMGVQWEEVSVPASK